MVIISETMNEKTQISRQSTKTVIQYSKNIEKNNKESMKEGNSVSVFYKKNLLFPWLSVSELTL